MRRLGNQWSFDVSGVGGQPNLPETLAALAQSAALPESRLGAVHLAEQLPTRAPEAAAVRNALLQAPDSAAALTEALSPPSPSRVLYMLQVTGSRELAPAPSHFCRSVTDLCWHTVKVASMPLPCLARLRTWLVVRLSSSHAFPAAR